MTIIPPDNGHWIDYGIGTKSSDIMVIIDHSITGRLLRVWCLCVYLNQYDINHIKTTIQLLTNQKNIARKHNIIELKMK